MAFIPCQLNLFRRFRGHFNPEETQEWVIGAFCLSFPWTFVTEINASARAAVTNMGGDIFNTIIYIVDSERMSYPVDIVWCTQRNLFVYYRY